MEKRLSDVKWHITPIVSMSMPSGRCSLWRVLSATPACAGAEMDGHESHQVDQREAAGWAVPIGWDGTVTDLPRGYYDGSVCRSRFPA